MLTVDAAQSSVVRGRPLPAVASLAAEISAACEGPAGRMGPHIIAALARAYASADLLTPAQRMPSPQRYARHVVHADPAGRFTILSLVWNPGQFSPPHAHRAWCAYAVCDNPLTETEYAYDAESMRAAPLRRVVRPRGYCCFGEAGLDQIHRLGNAGARPAISLHVYGVEAGCITTHVNRMVDVT